MLPEWLNNGGWLISIILILTIGAAADTLQRRLGKRLTQQADLHADRILQHLDTASLSRPLSLLIWVVTLTLAVETAGRSVQLALVEQLPTLRSAGVIIALAWLALGLVRGFENLLRERYLGQPTEGGPDRTTITAIGKLLRVVVLIAAALVLLQTLGFSISGVLAFGGVGGIVVGFAARDLLANFFGSLMIYLDRPLSVGDWIRSPDRDIEGTVEHIGWRLTRIRTFDRRPIYVPNSVFTTIAVENPSRMTHRRIFETVGIRYRDIAVMAPIVADVRTLLEQHEAIDSTQTLIVNFNSFGESSLDFFIYALTRETRWGPFHAIKQDILLAVAEIITGHGAQIAFPTRTLHTDIAGSLCAGDSGGE